MRWNHMLASVVLSLGLLPGCKYVVRDAAVYKAEVNFDRRFQMEQADQLAHWIANHCQCTGEAFTDESCEKSAKLVVLARAHAGWHADMKLYLGSLIEERPGELPVVPPTSSLCPKE